jgi:hypothetical protein
VAGSSALFIAIRLRFLIETRRSAAIGPHEFWKMILF